MAQYLPLPDGSYIKLREGETPAAAWMRAQQQYPEAFGATPAAAGPKESTLLGEVVRGAKQLGSTTRTGIGALTAPEEAAIAGVERGQRIAEEAGAGPSFAALRKVYEEQGLLPAAGELISQVPRAVAGQLPQLAVMAGGAKAGAMAGAAAAPLLGPAAPFAPVVGGVLGAGATLLPQFFGANVERQAAEQMARGEPVDIDRAKAAAAAAGQAGIEATGTAFVLGKRVVKGVLGITDDAALATAKAREELVKAASRSTLGAAGRGAAVGLAEVPVEVAQAVIERAQAGLDVLSPEAFVEYGENAYLAGLVGPTLGAATRVTEPGAAREKLAAEDRIKAAEEKRAAREAEAAEKAKPEYALKLETDYQAAVARMKELQAAVPKRPAKDALPEEQMAYKEAVEARNTHLKEVLQPLATEYVPRKAEIAQLKERQRVEGMTPEDYMLEQMGVKVPKEAAPTTLEESAAFAAPPAAPVAPELTYADEQLTFAKRQGVTQALDADEQRNLNVEFLMQDPAMAQRLVATQAQIPGLKPRENASTLALLKTKISQYLEQEAAALAAERPDLAPARKEVDAFAPWKQAIEAEERLREEEAMAVEPVRKEEAVIDTAAEQRAQAQAATRKTYLDAIDAYQAARGTSEAPAALQPLLDAKRAYEGAAGGRPIGTETLPPSPISEETEAQLDRALTEIAGEAPVTPEVLEQRIETLADARKRGIARVSENASELAQYDRLTRYMGTPQGLTQVARTPEMAEAAERRKTPLLERAQQARNEAIAAAIQEIRLQRDLSGLAPLDKTDAELQTEFATKLQSALTSAQKGKSRVNEEQRQRAIADQLQRVNARIQALEGGDRAGRLLGYASAFRTAPERKGELNNLYKAYRNLTTQQGLTPQAAQLNRTLQNLVDFYTIGGGAAKPRITATGPRQARRELVLGERAFTGYEPTVEGTEVRYDKPRKIAEYRATPEDQALVEQMRTRELAELNEAADQRYTPETSERVKQQIFDELRQRLDALERPATQEEVARAKAEAPAVDEDTGDLFAAATERAKEEFQTAVARRTAARSELGRAMAGMRGKSAVMDQAQRLAEKFGKDLGLQGTYAEARKRLTAAQRARLAAETEAEAKGQEALLALADDAKMAQQDAEAISRSARNTVEAIATRLAAEKETPAVKVRTPPRAMEILRKIVALQALIGQKQTAVVTGDKVGTTFAPVVDVGSVKQALDQATRAAKEGETWASRIEQVQAHMATLEKYLSRREAQGRLLPEAELMAKQWYRKLAEHEAALRRPTYGAGQLTPAEIRKYTQYRLQLAQTEYDRIKTQIDGLHRQLLDTEVAVAKREADRITAQLNALTKRIERREGADLAQQEMSVLVQQHKDALQRLEEAKKVFEERKKAESVPFTRKSPVSALAQWTKDAEARFEQSVQRFKDKQKALELQFATPETRTGEAPVTTAAQRRAEIEQEKAATAREATGAFMPVPQTLQDQLEGALKAQSKLKKRGSKKQRAAIAQRIQEIRSQLSGLGRYGQEYYDTTVAEFEAQDEAEAREAGKEETTRAGRRKAAKEIFGVQRTIAETGEVPQAAKDGNKLDNIIKNNRQAFEMAVAQGFKSTAIRPQKRGKSATPERLMRTPLEGIAYRLRQEIVEKMAAPQTKQQKQELNKLRNELYGLEEAINTPPVTVEERRRTARAVWAKLPKDMRNSVVDTFKGRTESGGVSTDFFDRFADALETTVIRERLGQPLSQAPVTIATAKELAPIQAETEKRVAATLKATEALRNKYYEQKEKELADKARLKGAIDAATQKQIEKEANEFADKVIERMKEEEARTATQRMTEPLRRKPALDEDDIEFSRGVPKDGLTKAGVVAELEKALGQKGVLDAQNVLTVVGSVADLKKLGNKLPSELKARLDDIPDDAKGFVYKGQAFLIAENIGQGHSLGVLLHEVGAHIGFRNFFNTAQYNALVETVKRWSTSKADTLEARIGRAAMERVKAAKTPSSQVNDELLAYAVEEAFNAGVEPAGVKSGSAVQNWLRMLVDGFKKALEKFGLAPQELKIGDLVNMAYGAANLELRGTWHGTGKPFKEFDFKYMGSGEGAQVYGWGTYRAQAHGTAKFYQKQEAEKQIEQWQQNPKIKEWTQSLTENTTFNGRTLASERERLEKIIQGRNEAARQQATAELYVFETLTQRARENNFKYSPAAQAERILKKGELTGLDASTQQKAEKVIDAIMDGTLPVVIPYNPKGLSTEDGLYYKNAGPYDEGSDFDAWYRLEQAIATADKTVGRTDPAAFMKAIKAAYKTELAEAEKTYKDSKKYKGASDYWKKTFDEWSAIDIDALVYRPIPEPPVPAPKGAFARVMSVRPDDEYYVLDFPLNRQSPAIQKAIIDLLDSDSVVDKDALRAVLDKDMSSSSRARAINSALRSTPPRTTLLLRGFGVAGYRYLDGPSRDKKIDKDSKFNYVDFFDKDEGPAIVGWDIDRVGPAEEILFSRNLPVASRVANQIVGEQKGWFQKIKDNLLGVGGRMQFVDMRYTLEEALRRGGVADDKALQAMYYVRAYDQRMHMVSQAYQSGAPVKREITRRDGEKEYIIESEPGANISEAARILTSKPVVKAAGSADAANKLVTLYMSAIRGKNVGFDKLNFGRTWAQTEIQRLDTELKNPKLDTTERTNLQKRRTRLEERLDTLPTEQEILDAKAEIEADPVLKDAFDKVREIYNEYNRNLIEFAVQSGAISREEANKLLKNNDYIPYYRMRGGAAELVIGNETPIRIGNLKDNPDLRELLGGDEPIIDFLTSSMQNTAMLLDMSMRNLATKNAMFELRDVGLARITKSPKGGAPANTITFKRDGEEYYAVVDTDALGIDSELVVKSMAGIPTLVPGFIRAMGIPARYLRRLIVASPVYWAKSLFRDTTAATLTSGANIVPVLGALRQIGKTETLERRGVTGGQVFSGMPEDTQRILKEMQAGKISLTNGMAWFEAKSAQIDAITRQNQYNSYIEQGLSELEATMMAMESMNFSRRGLSPAVHWLNTMIPFFNSQIQGLDVLYRSFTGKMPLNDKLGIKRKLWLRGSMIFGMSMAYAAMMQDDEAYKNASPEDKYGNWFVRLPGVKEPLRLPIPFELGYVFKALPEALVNIMVNEKGGEEAFKALKHFIKQMIPGASNYFLPQAIKPALEAAANYSIYTERDIESVQEQEKEPWRRYRDSTTEVAKDLGKLTNFSPVMMEYLVRGYTGSLGMALLQALSFTYPKGEVEKAPKRLSEMPVIGSLFQPNDARGIIDATFRRVKEIESAQKTYDDILKEGNLAAATEYAKRKAEELSLTSVAGNFREMIGELTAQAKEIQAARGLSGEQKRRLLDQIRQQQIRIATSARQIFDRSTRQAVLA